MVSEQAVTVIGGGIGGYPAAIRAARMGARVTLIEKAELGGTCLNQGCIPTKSFLQSIAVARTVKEAHRFGVKTAGVEIDFTAMSKRKTSVVRRLRKGVESLLAARNIRVIQGSATVLHPKTVRIVETNETVSGDALILATGSVPDVPAIPGLDQPGIWTSDDFLAMVAPPSTVAIIGGGVIGVEVAQVLAGLGVSVTVLELMPQLTPGLDLELASGLAQELRKQGVRIVTEARVTAVTCADRQYVVNYAAGDGPATTLEVQRVIVATGRRPASVGTNAEELGLELERGAIRVNERMQTTVDRVYAAGDVTGGWMLAHVAAAEGECAAINALGGERHMRYNAVPACIYTSPEVASVGLSEEQAKASHEVEVGRFPFAGCGKAVVLNATSGFVKIVADKKHKEILGIHIIGPHATDLIAEAVLAMSLESTAYELAEAMHPHPTLTETMMEAAQALTDGAIHMP